MRWLQPILPSVASLPSRPTLPLPGRNERPGAPAAAVAGAGWVPEVSHTVPVDTEAELQRDSERHAFSAEDHVLATTPAIPWDSDESALADVAGEALEGSDPQSGELVTTEGIEG